MLRKFVACVLSYCLKLKLEKNIVANENSPPRLWLTVSTRIPVQASVKSPSHKSKFMSQSLGGEFSFATKLNVHGFKNTNKCQYAQIFVGLHNWQQFLVHFIKEACCERTQKLSSMKEHNQQTKKKGNNSCNAGRICRYSIFI